MTRDKREVGQYCGLAADRIASNVRCTCQDLPSVLSSHSGKSVDVKDVPKMRSGEERR